MKPSYRDRPFGVPLSEADIQRAVFQHLGARKAPGVFAWHTPNGGFRRPREAAMFKGQGVRAGIPDLLALKDGKLYALELKVPGGQPSSKQIETMQELQRSGATVAVAHGLDRALQWLEEWGLLQGSAA